jgi:hypothetical protein
MAKKPRSKDDLKEIDVLVERLREFVRLNYMTAAEVARQIGVNDWCLRAATSKEGVRACAQKSGRLISKVRGLELQLPSCSHASSKAFHK